MFRLINARDEDRGAVAIIVALLFGFGVMLGLAALTIDVGNIDANRRQLQNGADAVALAAVKICTETGVCPDATNAGLEKLENANANPNAAAGVTDGIRRVDGGTPICGQGDGLPACSALSAPNTGNLQECPAPTPALPAGTNYIRVYTETTNVVGVHLLPYSFAAAITGAGSGTNQQTCASVIWGQPSGASAPLTLSYCDWAAATGNNPSGPVAGAGTYAANPSGASPGYGGVGQTPWPMPAQQLSLVPTPIPVPGQEIIISLAGSSSASPCTSWNGHDSPGGFGYLATSTSCTATAAVNGWMQVNTGNTLPSSCTSLFPYFNTVIYLPVFDCSVSVTGTNPIPTTPPLSTTPCTAGNGSHTYYHILGYAKFYLSGYRTSGSGVPANNNDRTQTVTPQAPCSGNDRCLSGWFLQGLVDAPPAPSTTTGGPPLGAYSIELSG